MTKRTPHSTPRNKKEAEIGRSPLPADAPVDLAQLTQMAPPKSQDFDQLVGLYESEMTRQLQEMELAIQAQAADKVRAIAHSALGASVLLGMQALAEPLRRLETVRQEEDWSNAAPLLHRAKSELARTRTYLHQFKKEGVC